MRLPPLLVLPRAMMSAREGDTRIPVNRHIDLVLRIRDRIAVKRGRSVAFNRTSCFFNCSALIDNFLLKCDEENLNVTPARFKRPFLRRLAFICGDLRINTITRYARVFH